jgi:hypothetical protein
MSVGVLPCAGSGIGPDANCRAWVQGNRKLGSPLFIGQWSEVANMADNSGSSGILGVLVGAFIVLAIGVVFLSYGGFGNNKSIDVNIKPPIATPK